MGHNIRGSVSHGTLRTEDLLSSFADCLESISKQQHVDEADVDLIREARMARSDYSDEESQWVLHDIMDALDVYAPEGFYFGAHEGDGSDFGFWECPSDE